VRVINYPDYIGEAADDQSTGFGSGELAAKAGWGEIGIYVVHGLQLGVFHVSVTSNRS